MDFVSTAFFGPKDERTLDDFDPLDTVLRLPGVSTVSLEGYDWVEDSAKLKDAQGESKQLVQKIKVFDRELKAMKDQRDGERQKRVRAEYKCKLLEKMLATKEVRARACCVHSKVLSTSLEALITSAAKKCFLTCFLPSFLQLQLELEHVQGELDTEKMKTEALKWRVAKAALAMSEQSSSKSQQEAKAPETA